MLGKTILDRDILSLGPPQPAELLPQRVNEDRAARSSAYIKVTNAKDFPVCCALAGKLNAKTKAPTARVVIVLLIGCAFVI